MLLVLHKNLQSFYEHGIRGVYEEGNYYVYLCDTEFSDLRQSDTEMNGSIVFTVNVKNTGGRPVTETVQLYIRDIKGSVVRPVRELKGIGKITLLPGESGDVRIRLDEKQLAFWHGDGTYAEPGLFKVSVSKNSLDVGLETFFELKKRN